MIKWLRSLATDEVDWLEFFLGVRLAARLRGPRKTAEYWENLPW